MKSQLLRYFVAAADELHFGRAAERLGIAQPALSQQIHALETELGVKLFRRANRRVTLTDAGQIFLGEARNLLTASERAVRLAREAERGSAGELHIGYSGSAVFEPRLRDVLHRFRSAYPGVTLDLHENAVEPLLRDLQEMRLDMAILRGPIGARPAGIAQTSFARARLAAALPAGHALAGETRLVPNALAGEGFISLHDSPGIGLAASLQELGARAGFVPRIALRAGSVMSVLGLVGAGLGVALIPELPAEFAPSSVMLKALDDPEAITEVLLLTRTEITSAVERRFLDLVRQTPSE